MAEQKAPKKNVYGGITFADNYSRSLEQFEKEFGHLGPFKSLTGATRSTELKKAFKIATTPISTDIEVNGATEDTKKK